MALCHLYPFSFPPSSHLGAIPSLPKPQDYLLKNLCSKREKASKAVKSNKELRDELREWMSGLGLPEDHVPSMKELCEHGRKDLANIVRQRGYKVIAELLRNPTEKNNYTELCSAKDEDLFDSEKHKTSEEKERTIDDSAESSFFSSMSASIEAFPDSLNGSTPLESSAIEVSIPSIKYLHAKANRFVLTGELDTLEEAAERPSSRNNNLLSQGLNASDSDASLASEMTLERQTRAEIDCLKNQLYQKEIELSKLKVQIEKEKLALSNLEAKANGEISNAQRIISAKDMELRLAEESLCGLKEVRIEYWATGETVEVAGSFNGWQHCIKMDLHPSSKSVKSTASRKSLLRSTILWLYPGIYEIKFIVDGEWRVDLQREMISCGNITNNVLRVDR